MSIIELSTQQRRDLILQLHEGASPSLSFYVLVVLSTVIAAYGLLANSTAVVIGAMLIAPLMGPIFGITAGLIRGERQFLLRALLAEGLGVGLAVGIACLIGLMPLRPDFTAEILARTQPTLFDLLIAFFSGLAGAYALVNPKVSPTIAGVAIATALVPPLAASGLCFASGNVRLGLGALLLFLINFLAIQFSAAIVFMLADLEERDGTVQRNRLKSFMIKFGPGLAALVLLGVFLTNVLVDIVTQRKVESQFSLHLSELLRESQGAVLNSSSLALRDRSWEYTAEVITPQAFSPAVVGAFEDQLAQRSGLPVHLIIRSLITRDCDRGGPVFVSEAERTGQEEQAVKAELLQQVSSLVSRETQRLPGALLTDLRRDEATQGYAFTATVQAPNAVPPQEVARLQKVLERRLAQPVKLVVRTLQTRDADSQRFVYSGDASAQAPTVAEVALQSMLEESIDAQLLKLLDGGMLLELSHEEANSRVRVHATVQAPRIITPPEVQRLQHTLRVDIEPRVDLTVETAVRAAATPDGYVLDLP